MPYVAADGVLISYERFGAGPQLVLLHGAAQENSIWRQVVEQLQGEFEIIAVDLPGHGKSGFVSGRPTDTIGEFADILAKTLRALGAVRPLVVGHSMGGSVVMRLAIDHPELLGGMISMAGSANSAGAAVSYPDGLLDFVSLNQSDWMEANVYSLIGPGMPRAQRWALAFDTRRIPAEVIQADLRAYTSCDFLDELATIAVPVTSVAGEFDWSCDPTRVFESHQRMGSPEDFHVIKGCGHMPHAERPDCVASIIRDVASKLELR